MSNDTLHIGERRLTIDDIVAVARAGQKVAIAPAAQARIKKGRAVLDRALVEGQKVYGMTTGLGAGVDTKVSAESNLEYQKRIVRARSVGVGEPLAEEQVRAIMATRISNASSGGGGIALHVVEAIAALLNQRIHPVVPSHGSYGMGDLAPLAHIALVLIGEGKADTAKGQVPGAAALADAGLSPVALASKDGLATLVTNSATTGLAALTIRDCQFVFEAQLAAAALSWEGFRCSLSSVDPRIQGHRPHRGQTRVAALFRSFFEGGALVDPASARRLQDPLGFRCVSHTMGAVLERLEAARATTELELNASGDNPSILIDEGEIVPSAHFDTTAIALDFESLALGFAHAANASVMRLLKLMSPVYSDLPRFLTSGDGSYTGFATVQKTAGAMEAMIWREAQPIGRHSAPVADGVEDVTTFATEGVLRFGPLLDYYRHLIAIELIVAAQAIDLRGVADRLGRHTNRFYQTVRASIPRLDDDRPMGPEFDLITDSIKSGEFPVGMDWGKAQP